MEHVINPERLPTGVRGQFSLDPMNSPTLPSRYYTDPAIYELEMRHIHRKTWCYVGHVADVAKPGMYFTDLVGEQPIVVVRGDDEVIRCFYNICQHRGHELLKGAGQLQSKAMTCPYHAWMYRLDGRLARAPQTEHVGGFDKSQFSLKSIHLAVAAGLIFVNLDPDCRPFEEEMEGFADSVSQFLPDCPDFVVAERLHYDINADWKTVVDNFSEAYHIPIAHPKLAQVLEQEMEELIEKPRWMFNRYHSKTGFPGLELEYGSPYYAWQAWPHYGALSLPGSRNLIVLRFGPGGVEKCAERADILTPAGETDNPKLAAVRDLFMHMFNIEDIGICESVQRGLRSQGYDQGRYICDQGNSWFTEIQLHWFHTQVLEALEKGAAAEQRAANGQDA
ncbi:MAG: aromatic ring-hydroxylating dioxygenase subunit alpha [Pseudomonadota bacterium]